MNGNDLFFIIKVSTSQKCVFFSCPSGVFRDVCAESDIKKLFPRFLLKVSFLCTL